jgi:hypothetical protein
MMWLTWRQHRTQTLVIYAAVAVAAVALAVTGPALAGLARTAGQDFMPEVQANGIDTFLYQFGIGAVIVLPGLVGAFWGAPLVARELDAGTHRLVWNQTITRNRWLATKLACAGLLATAAAGLLSLAVTWWSAPIDTLQDLAPSTAGIGFDRMSPVVFDARGIVPIGYAAFAFALGVTLGIVLRRAVPALATTLALFVGLQLVWSNFIRGHLITPVTTTIPINTETINGIIRSGPNAPAQLTVGQAQPGSWILSSQTINAQGQAVNSVPLVPCQPTGGHDPLGRCFAQTLQHISNLGYREQVILQPDSRFWALQWYELGIFLAAAAVLVGFAFWWLRRHHA